MKFINDHPILIGIAVIVSSLFGYSLINQGKAMNPANKQRNEMIGYAIISAALIVLALLSKSLLIVLCFQHQHFLADITGNRRQQTKSEEGQRSKPSKKGDRQNNKKKHQTEEEQEDKKSETTFVPHSVTSLQPEVSSGSVSQSMDDLIQEIKEDSVDSAELIKKSKKKKAKKPIAQPKPLLEQPKQVKQEVVRPSDEQQDWEEVESKRPHQQPKPETVEKQTKKSSQNEKSEKQKVVAPPKKQQQPEPPVSAPVPPPKPEVVAQPEKQKKQKTKSKPIEEPQQPIVEEDNQDDDEGSDWVEIGFKKIGREIKPKEELPKPVKIQKRSDLLSEEEKRSIQELEQRLNERVQNKFNELETKQRNQLVERQTGFKVRDDNQGSLFVAKQPTPVEAKVEEVPVVVKEEQPKTVPKPANTQPAVKAPVVAKPEPSKQIKAVVETKQDVQKNAPEPAKRVDEPPKKQQEPSKKAEEPQKKASEPPKKVQEPTKVEHQEPKKVEVKQEKTDEIKKQIIQELQPVLFVSKRDLSKPFFNDVPSIPENTSSDQVMFGHLKRYNKLNLHNRSKYGSFRNSNEIQDDEKKVKTQKIADVQKPEEQKPEKKTHDEPRQTKPPQSDPKPTQQEAKDPATINQAPKQQKTELLYQVKETTPIPDTKPQPQERPVDGEQNGKIEAPQQVLYKPKEIVKEPVVLIPPTPPKENEIQFEETVIEPPQYVEKKKEESQLNSKFDDVSPIRVIPKVEPLTEIPTVSTNSQPQPQFSPFGSSSPNRLNTDLYDNQNLAQSFGEVSQQDTIIRLQDEKRKRIQDDIPVEFFTLENGEKVLSLETMLSIVDYSVDIVREQYGDYTKSMREVRRKLLFEDKDYNLYLSTLLTIVNDLFDIMHDGYEQVYMALNIDDELFELSYVHWGENESSEEKDENDCSQFSSRITFLQQELKECVKSKVNLLKRQGKDIVKYQLDLISNPAQFQIFDQIKLFFSNTQEQQSLLPAVLSYVIEDLIFQKFAIEEEDKIKFLKTNKYDKELQQLLMELDEASQRNFEVQIEH